MSSNPFEGPEKLLEIWFAPSPHGLGLRSVPQSVWEDMLDIVKCKVLSVVHGDDIDAYLLRSRPPMRIFPSVHRCFYSRKSFMFPERQLGPHRDWKHEVEFLDNIFPNGAAYTVGKVNGDHWLLYMAGPTAGGSDPIPSSPTIIQNAVPDYTIEILMSDLAPSARHPEALSASLGISDIFPSHLTTLDAYSFSPCGYSANALIKWGSDPVSHDTPGEGYYTIHVTPEEGWSYASFECNVPLPSSRPSSPDPTIIPDLLSLIRRVVTIFRPGRLSLTLFVSSGDNENDNGESAIEAAQRAFKAALTEEESTKNYRRTDKINYEFGGYDLAFASFELKP
ncbi:adenosylmethionine decarboxylase [Mycena amicta]|nr:adenosylmethionine decarboxylase [Mycena amicta]